MEQKKLRDEVKKYYDGPIPPGYNFNPTDEVLIIHYLQPKINDLDFPKYLIHDDTINISDYDPEFLTKKYTPQWEKWYLFKNVEGECREANRKARDGYWKVTGVDKAIYDKYNKIIGFRKPLVFCHHKDEQKKCWVMHEFSTITENQPNEIQDTSMRIVLCKIFEQEKEKGSSSRQNKDDSTEAEDHEVDEDSSEADDDYIYIVPKRSSNSDG